MKIEYKTGALALIKSIMQVLISGIVAICLFLISPITSAANDANTIGITETVTRLQSDLKTLSSRRIESVDALEFSVSASDENQLMQSQASFFLPAISFDVFSNELSSAANWCNVLLLHLNVKTCVYRSREERTEIDLYLGRKYYQEPPEASKIKFNFNSLLSESTCAYRINSGFRTIWYLQISIRFGGNPS